MRTIKASFRIASVVPRTISENTNVQIGSAIAQDGWKGRQKENENIKLRNGPKNYMLTYTLNSMQPDLSPGFFRSILAS